MVVDFFLARSNRYIKEGINIHFCLKAIPRFAVVKDKTTIITNVYIKSDLLLKITSKLNLVKIWRDINRNKYKITKLSAEAAIASIEFAS